MNMLQLTRVAQSAFNKAGYSKDDGYKFAQQVVEDVIANLSEYQEAYKLIDIDEIVEMVSKDVVASM